MADRTGDQNLLLGLLALQLNFVNRPQLVAAFDHWTSDKTRLLGQILVEHGALDSDEHALLEALAAKHVQRHDNDPQKSLADLTPVGAARDDLARLADPDLEASLAHVSAVRAGDHLPSTLSHTAGTPTSAGTRFRVLRPHAHGGLGEVYVAVDEELHREVALKEIQKRRADEPDSRARFLLEAEITGGLEHPGIVPVYGLGTYADGRPFYAMRFIRGDSLKEAIERFHSVDRLLRKENGDESANRLSTASSDSDRSRLQSKRATDAFSSVEFRNLLGRFIDVCNAIEYAHSRGVLHRDLKPGNIMLGKYGETLVVDWGLAKVVGHHDPETESDEPTLRPTAGSGSSPTEMGRAIGTPQFMSPEQAEGRLDQLGPASDVYSLGATLYALLTGEPPFSKVDTRDVVARVARGDFPRPRALNPEIPQGVEAVCLKAMSLRPAERYASPRTLADDIEHWLADEPVSAHRDSATVRLGRWGRRHRPLVAAAAALLIAAVFALGASNVLISREQQRTLAAQRERALAQVEALLDANPSAVPNIIHSLEPFRKWVVPRLRELASSPLPAEKLRRVRLALLPVEPARAGELYAELFDAEPEEFVLLRDSLAAHRDTFATKLWALALGENTAVKTRFRAACCLAACAPNDARWDDIAGACASQLVAENSVYLGTWKTALRPVRESLYEPLLAILRDARWSATERLMASEVLAEYAADNPNVLVELVVDATPEQFPLFFEKLRQFPQEASEGLSQVLAREPEARRTDAPIAREWPTPVTDVLAKIESAHGIIAERFALCQTMPLPEFLEVAERLRPAGYRPGRAKPFFATDGTRIAAIWLRDGRDWRFEHDASAAEIIARDESLRGEDFLPIDATAYHVRAERDNFSVHYAGLWLKRIAGDTDAQLFVDLSDTRLPLDERSYVRLTVGSIGEEPSLRSQQELSMRFWAIAKQRLPHPGEDARFALDDRAMRELLKSAGPVVDLNLLERPPNAAVVDGLPAYELAERDRVLAGQALESNPNDLHAIYQHAVSSRLIGQPEAAIVDLTKLIDEFHEQDPMFFRERALANAQRGQADAAHSDLLRYSVRSLSDSASEAEKAYVRTAVSSHLGDDENALRLLEEYLAVQAANPELEFQAARAYAEAAAVVVAGKPDRAARYVARALELMQLAAEHGYTGYENLATFAGLDVLRTERGWSTMVLRILQNAHLKYNVVWWETAPFESQSSYGLRPEAHLEECRQLAERGYVPVAVSTTILPRFLLIGDQTLPPFVTASVWHRPGPTNADRDTLADEKANAAIALALLGRREDVVQRLVFSSDQRVRTYLVHRLGRQGVVASELFAWYESESDASARRAMVLALGEFDERYLSGAERDVIALRLLKDYRGDPDAGLHSAIDWLLRRWGREEELATADGELASDGLLGDRGWYVNHQGQTFAVFNSPELPGRRLAVATKEVTVEQFIRLVPETVAWGHRHVDDGRWPARDVLAEEAVRYCRLLSEKEKIPESQMCYPTIGQIERPMTATQVHIARSGYRLPTRKELLSARLAGAGTLWHFGSDESLLSKYAWHRANSNGHPEPVGRLKPNDLGVFDMIGNVAELHWNETYFFFRSYRGGSYDDDSSGLNDGGTLEDFFHSREVGFRVVRTLPEALDEIEARVTEPRG